MRGLKVGLQRMKFCKLDELSCRQPGIWAIHKGRPHEVGGWLANADAGVNFACKRPNFADVGRGGSKMAKLCDVLDDAPLSSVILIRNIFYLPAIILLLWNNFQILGTIMCF